MKAVVRVFLDVVGDPSVVWVSVKSPAVKAITVLPVMTALGVKRAVAVNVQQNQDVLVKVVLTIMTVTWAKNLDVCTDTEKCNCDHDSECPIGEICCHGSCSEKSDCSANSHNSATLVIIGSVLGSLVLINLISIVIYLIYRRHHRNILLTGSIQTVPVFVTIPNNTAQNVPTSHAAENHASLGKLNAPQNDYGAISSHRIYHTH